VLWFNGIVVVVSAGNNGSTANGILYPPANDPFVISVGAVDDKGTAAITDDEVASFSAYGVTNEGFAKPDLVAPGKNIVSLLASDDDNLVLNHTTFAVNSSTSTRYFRMSGTSMASAVVAGAAALLLQDEPNLTPDQVKYRLTATANKTWSGYTALKAGAGYLDIYAAVNSATTQSANTNIPASQLLWTGATPVNWTSVNWNSVNWNSVNWNSVNWNSVNWNSVNWNSVDWGN
jgi:serine protease AprX